MVCQEGYLHQAKARTQGLQLLGHQNRCAGAGNSCQCDEGPAGPQHMPIQYLEIAPAWHRGAGVECRLSIRFCFSDKAKLSLLPWCGDSSRLIEESMTDSPCKPAVSPLSPGKAPHRAQTGTYRVLSRTGPNAAPRTHMGSPVWMASNHFTTTSPGREQGGCEHTEPVWVLSTGCTSALPKDGYLGILPESGYGPIPVPGWALSHTTHPPRGMASQKPRELGDHVPGRPTPCRPWQCGAKA